MRDSRIDKWARLLVRYSLEARRGQTVAVTGGVAAESLLLAVYEDLLRVGAFPMLEVTLEGAAEAFYRLGQEHHFNTLPAVRKAVARNVDAQILIRAAENTRQLSGVDPKRQGQFSKACRAVDEIRLSKPWVLTLFPTSAYAQEADLSLRALEDFVFRALYADEDDPVACWKELGRRQQKLVRRLAGADRVRIVGDQTDLSFSVKGRVFVSSDGKHNMPSGEVFTGPVEDSAEGFIAYDYPVCHAGREIDGVRLVFRKGRVVEATARKNGEFLHQMLDLDEGARRLGELGIGTNTRIDRFTKNILFDEKIGGTIHLALGRSYPETGGKNRSALHWDMIKDLRHGGTLSVDGRPFLRDGKFV